MLQLITIWMLVHRPVTGRLLTLSQTFSSMAAAPNHSAPQITPHEVRQIPGYCKTLKTQGFQKEIKASKP
jgi:hypothetical protein